MSLAMKRLKNIGWLALVFLVAIMLYPLSLNVAALHSDLLRVDRTILDTQREISFLQAELRTRASMQQLEEWNELLYGYQPPTAQQFLSGEAALAEIGSNPIITKPVMIAASNSDSDIPARRIGGGNLAAAAERLASSPEDNKKPIAIDKVETLKPQQTRTERLASIDRQLLSDDFLQAISARAERERARR